MRLPGTCVMLRFSGLFPRVPAFTLRLPFSQTTPALPTGAKESSRLFLFPVILSLARPREKGNDSVPEVSCQNLGPDSPVPTIPSFRTTNGWHVQIRGDMVGKRLW